MVLLPGASALTHRNSSREKRAVGYRLLQDGVAFPVEGVFGESAGTVPPPPGAPGPKAGRSGVLLEPHLSSREHGGIFPSQPEWERKRPEPGEPFRRQCDNVPPWATQAAAGRRLRLPTSGGTGKPGSETWPRATRQRKHRLSRNSSFLTRETERPKPE